MSVFEMTLHVRIFTECGFPSVCHPVISAIMYLACEGGDDEGKDSGPWSKGT